MEGGINPNRTCHAVPCVRAVSWPRNAGWAREGERLMNEEMSYTMIAASAPRSNCEATHGSKAQPLSPQDDAQSNPNSSALGRWVKWEWWVKWEYWACTVRSGVSQGKGSWEYWRHHLDSLAGLDEADSVSILLRSAPSTTIARLHVLVQPRRDVQDAACKAQRHNTKGV